MLMLSFYTANPQNMKYRFVIVNNIILFLNEKLITFFVESINSKPSLEIQIFEFGPFNISLIPCSTYKIRWSSLTIYNNFLYKWIYVS